MGHVHQVADFRLDRVELSVVVRSVKLVPTLLGAEFDEDHELIGRRVANDLQLFNTRPAEWIISIR